MHMVATNYSFVSIITIKTLRCNHHCDQKYLIMLSSSQSIFEILQVTSLQMNSSSSYHASAICIIVWWNGTFWFLLAMDLSIVSWQLVIWVVQAFLCNKPSTSWVQFALLEGTWLTDSVGGRTKDEGRPPSRGFYSNNLMVQEEQKVNRHRWW